jgi:RsiW-degrading membrane proteinase PrsW (M82 family)
MCQRCIHEGGVLVFLGYWDIEDYLAAASFAISVASIYFSFEVIRASKGAPQAWYLFIAAFVSMAVFRGVQLYFDLQHPPNTINDWEVSLALLVGAFLLAGLVLLARTFRIHLNAVRPGS